MKKYRNISFLSCHKILNYTNILLSFRRSVFCGEAVLWAMPANLSIELTNFCNLRCKQCPTGMNLINRPKGYMEKKLFCKIIDESEKHLISTSLHLQGESFLHPEIFDFISYARSNNIYTCCSTNGNIHTHNICDNIVKSGLSELVISMDGLTQHTYEQYRVGGSVDTVKMFIENLVHSKKKFDSKTPYIELQFLVFRFNEHELNDFYNFGINAGVNSIRTKSAQVYDVNKNIDILPSNTEYSRYIQGDDGRFRLSNSLGHKCRHIWRQAAICFDGSVVPCCYDKDAAHVMGDITKQTLQDIWYGEHFMDFRTQVLNNHLSIDICGHCNQ